MCPCRNGHHRLFYEEYGVEECYVFDPDSNDLQAYVRGKAALVPAHPGPNFASPRLGVRFDRTGGEMIVRYPDGRPFLTLEELDRLHESARQRAEDEHKRAEDEHKRADDEHKRADDEHKRAVRLAELTQKAILQQATTEEQEELRTLMASLLKG